MKTNWLDWLPLFIALAALVPQILNWYNTRKTKQDKDTDLASNYLKIADMTGEQLEKKINQINVLEKQIESLQAQITAMQIDFKNKEIENAKVIEALKAYIKILVDILRENNIDIPARPDILKESNPRIKAVQVPK